MAAQNFKVFYDPTTGQVNRAVICDGPDETDDNLAPHMPAPGEFFSFLPRSAIPAIDFTIDDVTAALVAAQAAQ